MRYLLFLLLVPTIVFAHGASTSLEQDTGDYTIEFEYNTEGNIKVGDMAIFDVFLLQDENGVHFDNAYIKIFKANGLPILFGTLVEDAGIIGNARIGGIIKEAGEYTGEVQFMKSGKQIGPLTFKFTADAKPVQASDDKKYFNYTPIIIGVVFVVGLGMAVMSRRKSATPPL